MPAPLNFRLVPLRLKPASGSYSIVRMPNGTTSSSTVVLPTRTLAVSVYMLGDVGLQSIGFATGTSTAKFTDAPAATFCAADVDRRQRGAVRAR